MSVVYMQQQLKITWLQCVHIHHPNMHFHTGNVCFVVVLISHELIFHTNNNIVIIPNAYPSICFHLYHLIEMCTVHGRRSLDENTKLFVFSISGYCDTCKTIHQKIDFYDGWQISSIWPQHHRKIFLLQLISTVQLPGTKIYNTQMVMHTGTCTSNVSLASEFQKGLHATARKHVVIDQGK